MADRVAVFNKGRIEQLAAPRELYLRPATPFVARFVGSANVADTSLAQKLGCRCRLRDPCREHRRAGGIRRGAAGQRGCAGRGGRGAVPWRRQPLAGEARCRRDLERVDHGRGHAPHEWPGRGRRASNSAGRATAAVPLARRRCVAMRAASTFFWRRPYWYLALLLVPPLLWFGTVYLGSLFALLAQSFYRNRRFHRADRARAHARDLPTTGNAAGQCRHRAAHADHGDHGHDCLRRHRTAHRDLHGASCERPHQGASSTSA